MPIMRNGLVFIGWIELASLQLAENGEQYGFNQMRESLLKCVRKDSGKVLHILKMRMEKKSHRHHPLSIGQRMQTLALLTKLCVMGVDLPG